MATNSGKLTAIAIKKREALRFIGVLPFPIEGTKGRTIKTIKHEVETSGQKAPEQEANIKIPVAAKVPWQELAMSAGECAELFGLSKDRFLRTIAYTQSFPERVNLKPAAWKAGEVIDWRDGNRYQNRKKRG